MAIVKIAGNTNYTIYFASTYTGSVGSETPDGDVLYIFAVDYDHIVQNLSKPKASIGKSLYYPATKYNITVNLKEVQVPPQGATKAVTEVSAMRSFFYNNCIKRGSIGGYLFIYNDAESEYDPLDWNTNGDETNYLICTTDNWVDKAKKGKIHVFPSLKFVKAG